MGKIFFLENGATNYIRLFPVIKKKKIKKKKTVSKLREAFPEIEGCLERPD